MGRVIIQTIVRTENCEIMKRDVETGVSFFFGMLRFTYYGEVRKNVFRLVHMNGKCVTFFASALLQERFRMV